MTTADARRTVAPAARPVADGSVSWGEPLKRLWRLDGAVRHLNHGAFGAVPRLLAAEQNRWRALWLRLSVAPYTDEADLSGLVPALLGAVAAEALRVAA